MSTTVLVQLLTATLGSLGFSVLLKMQPRHLPLGTLGGTITWLCYYLALTLGAVPFTACLCGALMANVWSWLMSRIRKAPAVIFTITAMVPLIPGGGLYYTMSSLLAQDWDRFSVSGTDTLLTAAAIGLGTLIFSALLHFATHFFRK